METWEDALGGRYAVDRLFQVRCSCGETATATLLTVTLPGEPPRVTRWFRPPADWFVSLEGDLKRIDDGKIIEGPFVRCSGHVRLSPYTPQELESPQGAAAKPED